MLIALAALCLVSLRASRLSKQKAADLEAQRQALVEKGQSLRENAKLVLDDGTNPIKDITALRNLGLALNCNPKDTEAAMLASNLLLQHVWCPPAAPAVTTRKMHYWQPRSSPEAVTTKFLLWEVMVSSCPGMGDAQCHPPRNRYLRSRNRQPSADRATRLCIL